MPFEPHHRISALEYFLVKISSRLSVLRVKKHTRAPRPAPFVAYLVTISAPYYSRAVWGPVPGRIPTKGGHPQKARHSRVTSAPLATAPGFPPRVAWVSPFLQSSNHYLPGTQRAGPRSGRCALGGRQHRAGHFRRKTSAFFS